MRSSSSTHLNESRWARKEEIRSSAMKINLKDEAYPAAGLPLLCDTESAYIDPSDTHTIIFGATGSKKTRLFCFPMLNMMIRAGESFIATDPKGELYARTAQVAQENGYKTVVLNFRDLDRGDCWNPLEIPYEMYHGGNRENAVSLINDFIAALSEPHRKTTNDLFWIETAASLALANMLLLLECGRKDEVNLASFSDMCSMDSIERINKITRYIAEDSIAGINYRGVFASAEKTLQSIQISLYAWVRLFVSQRKLTRMLAKSTFDMRDIGREKTAVYIIVPDEKSTYNFLVTTFIKQVYETLITVAQNAGGRLPVRVNFVLDEFCNLPAIPDMPAMISAARSRNMRCFLVVQGMHQLKAKYGEDAETIKGNCENWVFMTSKELSLLNEISELCGSYVTSGGHTRRLISVSELQRLSKEKGEVLLLYGRKYPFITELPDISEYRMFEPSGIPKMKVHDVEYRKFSLVVIHHRLERTKKKLFADELDCCTVNEEIPSGADAVKSKLDEIFGDIDLGETDVDDSLTEGERKRLVDRIDELIDEIIAEEEEE